MSIEKLELVSIVGALPQLDEAIIACLQSRVFHIENAGKLIGTAEDSGGFRADADPYADALRALSELDLRQISPDTAREPLPGEFSPEQIIGEAGRISGRLREVRQQLEETRRRISEYENASIHLKYLQSSDIDLGELTRCRHIVHRFGRMPEENLQKLGFYSDEGFIFQAYHTAHEYVWGFYFAEQTRIASVDAIMKGLLFEEYRLPEDLDGTPQQALESLRMKLTEQKAQLETLGSEEHRIYESEAPLLGRMYCYAKYQSEVAKLRAQCIVMHDKFNLMGYVPVSEKEQFRQHIDNVPDLAVAYEEPLANSQVQPPVRLKNGWFSKPVSRVVEMYGLPNYNGYNPTAFVAITYTLLFGIMFGDLGQGLVIALLGFFLHKKKNLTLGAVMTRIGVSSAFFGTLYGSVFGFEEALDPFYEKLGIHFLPLKAMENINFIIFGAVGIGAAMIIISMLVNIVTKIRRRNYADGVFGNNGLAGLAFFVTVLLLIGGLITGKQLIPKGAAAAVIIVTMLLMFFREPLGHFMAHKHYESEGIGDFILLNLFECFEFLISYTSNTISFIRVGGFVFSHAGLMSVVMLLAKMAEKSHMSVGVIILGNAFVMGLEGLLVGIQVLRLEFYETFSRCYDGDGQPFTPVTVSFDDFSETKQSEQTAKA